MNRKGFLPDTDAALLAWSVNLRDRIATAYAEYGIPASMQASYALAHDAYAAAYQTAVDPISRTRGKVAAKNAARQVLRDAARRIAKVVDGQENVTDEQRIDLGLGVRPTPTPIPPPSAAPDLDVISVDGRVVRLRIHDAAGDRRARPTGVAGASVFSHVGEVAPTSIADWTFQGSTTRTTFDVQFDAAVAPGAKVWLTAFWFNPRSQSGPAAAPVSAHVQFGGVTRLAA